MNPIRRPGLRASLFSRGISVALLGLLSVLCAPSHAQTGTDRIASKSISRVYAVQSIVFAMAEDGQSFSWMKLFESPEKIETVEWPWDGAAEGGVPWRSSMLLRANYFPGSNDSQRVVRVAQSQVNLAPSPARGDSLIFKDTNTVTANGAGLTALAVRGDTALLGFGRLGLVYARLGSSTASSGSLFQDSTVAFQALPSAGPNTLALKPCVWNHLCRSDTLTPPSGGLDSVISVAIDSTGDSTWILVSTQKGLRRGLWRGTSFPYVALPGIHDTDNVSVRSVFASPAQPIAWAFTGLRFFYSDDHGATFRIPDTIPGLPAPSQFTSYSASLAPQVAFSGDTSFINFNMDSVGIARFRHDTVLAITEGPAVLGLDQVLLNANDSLDIHRGEGSLTGLTVARLGTASVLVVGTSLKGIFYRRLDQSRKTFTNLTRLAPLKSGLGEVITYPTLFQGPGSPGAPEFVRIGYRLKKSGKVTITVYNYAMEKVRVVVRNAPRQGGVARSENIGEDRWDGRDSGGRLVSVGTYYVRVESDQGEAAFGKVICVRGRK